MTVSLPEFRLEVYLNHWERSASRELTASDAQTMTIGEILALASEDQRERLDRLPLGYTPTGGSAPLLRAIATTYDIVEPEHVVTFAGAEEAMFWVIQEIVGPGDHAIVTVPNYQAMESITLATGATVEALRLDPDDGWSVHLGEIERLLRPNTQLVAVNFPNNPTGALPDPATFASLVKLCDEHRIWLFSDETQRGVELDPARTLRQAADLSERAVSLNVMSKAYGLPGLRIGWIACRNRALLEQLGRHKHYTSNCNAGPSEHLATLALSVGDQILDRNRAIIAQNLPLFDAFFAEWNDHFAWEHPQGGCVCFPRLTTGESATSFCQRLAEQAGVMLFGADVFQSDLMEVPLDRFRIGVARQAPSAALEAMASFLEHEPT